MANIVSNLASDPLVDGKGVPLEDEKCDASLRKLVKYIRSLKPQDVPQQVQGKALVDVSRLLMIAHGCDLRGLIATGSHS